MKRFYCIFLFALIFSHAYLSACTIFYFSRDNITLVGRNLDWINPNAFIYFVPPEKGRFGWVYFAFDKNDPQGGLNDQGLFFGNTTTEPEEVILSQEKKNCPGNLMKKIMTECSTVKEAVQVFKAYNLQFLVKNHIFVADKAGNSAVIEGNAISRKEGPFQILTNFRYSRARENPDYKPGERYNIAKNMLDSSSPPSIDRFRKILAATCQEGVASTIYSYIIDFNDLNLYLYHYHNFENVLIIDLLEELQKGKQTLEISSLFPRTYAAEGFKRWKLWDFKQRSSKKTIAPLNPGILDAHIGEYQAIELVTGMKVHILKENNKLYFQVPYRSKLELLPESEVRFYYLSLDGDFSVIFIKDESGKTVELLYEEDGIKIPFKKVK